MQTEQFNLSEGQSKKQAAQVTGSKDTYKTILNAWVAQGKVKKDEVFWSGVTDWLDTQTGKVAKADVLAYLEKGGVKVEETLLEAGNANYPGYQTPGGKQYRELLLTLPERQGSAPFKSSNFDEPNIIAHIRFNERTGNNGEKIMHIEEVQSDRAQAFRKKGSDARVPDAPFVKDTEAWTSLALKRAIRYAAENGFDQVTILKGSEQAARYPGSAKRDAGMRAYYDEIVPNTANKILKKLGGGKIGETEINVQGSAKNGDGLSEVSRYVGPEHSPAQLRALANERNTASSSSAQLRGIAKLVEEGTPFADAAAREASPATAELLGGGLVARDYVGLKVHRIDITPAVRDAAMQGQPLFAKVPKEYEHAAAALKMLAEGDEFFQNPVSTIAPAR